MTASDKVEQKNEAEGSASTSVSPAFSRYALFILLLVYTMNFLDRQIVAILAEPIKNDLAISDTEIGLLTGVAFGLIYCGFGIPLARLADRANRVWIISGSLAVWSFFTILCGRAVNLVTLAGARMGVGLGEAGCTPTAHSLISDYVPREKRASALAFFSMGTPIGSFLGLSLGGLIADAYGWRSAFLFAGLPGLLLAVVVLFTLKEPRHGGRQPGREKAGETMTFGQTLGYLRAKPTYWYMAFGASIRALVGYGQGPFLASFFLRVHGSELQQMAAGMGLKPLGLLGVTIGLTAGVAGTAGAWIGGIVADRFAARDFRIYGGMPAVAALVSTPFFCASMLVDSLWLSFALLLPSIFASALWFGPVYASAQSLVAPHMRATSASILLFVINMVGLGLGALTVGLLSDFFNFSVGLGAAEGVRWALIATAALGFLEALLFWKARQRIRDDVAS